MTVVAGVDAGTGYFKISMADSQGNPVMLRTETGEESFPSVAFFPDDGDIIVGQEAVNMGMLDPKKLVSAWKRHMGTNEVLITSRGKDYTAKDMLVLFLNHAKELFERRTGECVDAIAVTVPANFSQEAIAHTKKAVEETGLECLVTVKEPTSAAIGNNINKRAAEVDAKFALLDLGHGTFDVSIVEVSGNNLTVIATAGVPRLGGLDFNTALREIILERFEAANGFRPTLKEHPIEWQQLQQQVEKAKLALSKANSTGVWLTAGGKGYEGQVRREEFNDRTKTLIDQAMDTTMKALEDAKLDPSSIQEFIPVGGASQMPCFLEAIEQKCGKKPSIFCEPHFAVALGAFSSARNHLEEQGGEATLKGRALLPRRTTNVVDIVSYPIGVLCQVDGHPELRSGVILKKGNRINAQYTEIFYLAKPGQDEAEIILVEAEENTLEKDCLTLGEFNLHGLPETWDRKHMLKITLRLDHNGLLSAVAECAVSGKTANLKIKYKGPKSAKRKKSA